MRFPSTALLLFYVHHTTLSSAQSGCTKCDDDPTPIMMKKNKLCGDFPNVIRNKCNGADSWKQREFCRYTCFKEGRGYKKDNCCLDGPSQEVSDEIEDEPEVEPIDGETPPETTIVVPVPSPDPDDLGVEDEEENVDSNKPFQLMMYFDKKYNWQGTSKRRRWCVQCSKGNNGDCKEGDSVRIMECNDGTKRQWWIRDGALIRSYNNKRLCWDYGNKEYELKKCGTSKEQKFIAGASIRAFSAAGRWDDDKFRFELYPEKKKGSCTTQRHHPKPKEQLLSLPCDRARDHDTAWFVAVAPPDIDGH